MPAPRSPSDDTDLYAYQREELLSRLSALARGNDSLVVHGRERLCNDDIVRVLQKIRQGYGFSRREREALTDAGFALDRLYPGR